MISSETKRLLPTNGKEVVLRLTSLEDPSKPIATIFPTYNYNQVRAAKQFLLSTAVKQAGMFIGLPAGEATDSRAEHIAVNLHLVTSAKKALVDLPAEVITAINEYNTLVDKEELSDADKQNLTADSNLLEEYFVTSRIYNL